LNSFVRLTKEDIIYYHKSVCDRFNTTYGILKPGLLDAVVIRPDQTVYGKETFPNIYLKAASMMEAIARWHIFVDGNKRTALLITDTYLAINDYIFIPPLSTVRFIVNVADTLENDNIQINKLIRNIANWLKDYTIQKGNKNYLKVVVSNIEKELNDLQDLFKIDSKKAFAKYEEWMAIDIYPQYKKDINEVKKFLDEIRLRNLRIIEEF
jgi:death on curing protein